MSHYATADTPGRVLIVEDSALFGRLLVRRVEKETGAQVDWMQSYDACRARLACTETGYDAALLDITLPDAPRGEIIDLVLARAIPVIVFTGSVSEVQREAFWAKRIADYILKQSECGIDLAVRQVKRLIGNRGLACLVVDDSKLYRKSIANLLAAHNYRVLEAGRGDEALSVLARHPDIRLIVTDYTMPGMDGVELTRAVRATYPFETLAIIGLSHTDDPATSSRFLKNGANDYIKKPFQVEEFYCRISLNIDMLNQFATIKALAETDVLAGTANRRALFAAGATATAQARENGSLLTVAMLDIDHFKSVNDRYGHDAGDAVIRHLGTLLRNHFPSPPHHVGRIGGEEFCIVSPGRTAADLLPAYETLRQDITNAVVGTRDAAIGYTVSIGLYDGAATTFEDSLREADAKMYGAKTSGRNKIAV